jgi:hypothetical protein
MAPGRWCCSSRRPLRSASRTRRRPKRRTKEIARLLTSAFISESVASIVGAAALALLSQAAGKRGVRPINAPSHWWHGVAAGSVREMDLQHTAVGYATHHAHPSSGAPSSRCFARDRNCDAVCIARDAMLVSAAAGATDYGPDAAQIEARLGNRSAQTLGCRRFCALAVGLGLGGLITRQISQR